MIKRIESKQVVVKVITKEFNRENYHVYTCLCDYDLSLNFLRDVLEDVIINTTNKPVWMEYQTGDKIGSHYVIVHNDYTLETTTKTFMQYIGID